MAAGLLSIVALACGSGTSIEDIRAMHEKGEYQESIEPLQALMKADPDDPEVQLRYGLALISTGRGGLAVWPLRKAMESPKWHLDAGLLLGTMMATGADWDGAIEVANGLLEENPDDARVLRLRARARIGSRRDYEGALADADRALEIDPDDIQALSSRTVALLWLGRERDAEVALEDLDARYRDDSVDVEGNPTLCAALATFAKEKGDLDVAAERFDDCLERFPSDGVVLREAIEFFDGQGQPDHSLEILRKILADQPDAHVVRGQIALRLRARGKTDEAIALMREATELPMPIDATEGWLNLAGFLVEVGHYDEGVDAYEEVARRMAQTGPEFAFSFADALILAKRYDRALEIADEMEPVAFREFVRGRVALERHQPQKALEHFDTGLTFWPDNAVARYYAAVAAEQTGQFERAIEHYRYAIRADESLSDAALRLARLYVADGREAEALAALNRTEGGGPGQVDMALLQLEIGMRRGWVRPPPTLSQILGQRDVWARAAAARARGVRARDGLGAAIKAIEQVPELDLSSPLDVAALEPLLGWLVEAGGRTAQAESLIDAALAAHPDEAAFHALHGEVLSHAQASSSDVRKAYDRALELDEKQPIALRGLAALEAKAGHVERAITLYRRAIEAEPTNRQAPLALARILVDAGRADEAEEPLEGILREHPYAADAALALARIRLDRGVDDARTRELARRAVRFKGGQEAKAFLSKLSATTGDETGEANTPES